MCNVRSGGKKALWSLINGGFQLPETNFLCQVDGRQDGDFKQRGDLLPPIRRTALTRGGQQPHPRRRLGERSDALLSQILQLQLVLAGVLLLGVDYLIGEKGEIRRPLTTTAECRLG